jgi:hypothetical protein
MSKQTRIAIAIVIVIVLVEIIIAVRAVLPWIIPPTF